MEEIFSPHTLAHLDLRWSSINALRSLYPGDLGSYLSHPAPQISSKRMSWLSSAVPTRLPFASCLGGSLLTLLQLNLWSLGLRILLSWLWRSLTSLGCNTIHLLWSVLMVMACSIPFHYHLDRWPELHDDLIVWLLPRDSPQYVFPLWSFGQSRFEVDGHLI